MWTRAERALDLCPQLQKGGVALDSVTFVGVLNACAIIVALGEGRHVHK